MLDPIEVTDEMLEQVVRATDQAQEERDAALQLAEQRGQEVEALRQALSRQRLTAARAVEMADAADDALRVEVRYLIGKVVEIESVLQRLAGASATQDASIPSSKPHGAIV